MTRLASRVTILAATTLVAVAQVVVAPAACCVLRSTLLGETPCCRHGAAEPQADANLPPCCRQHAEKLVGGPRPVGQNSDAPAPSRPESCLWCTAVPKASSSERAVAPAPDQLFEFVALPPIETPSAASVVTREVAAAEPFSHTALASCALLCVWRK